MRRMSIPLPWDVVVDSLSTPKRSNISYVFILTLRLYRVIRPKYIGDRCGYEPSCSRYSELCFRKFGVKQGLKLTYQRLCRCNGSNGGLDIPPGFPHNIDEVRRGFHAVSC